MKAFRLILAAALAAFIGMTDNVTAQNRPPDSNRKMSENEIEIRRQRDEEMKKIEEETRKKMEERFPGKNYTSKMQNAFPDERGFRGRLMVMWQLTDYLNIDGKTADVFFPVYMDFLKNRDKLTDDQRRVSWHIIESIDNPSISPKDLQKDVDYLKKIEIDLKKTQDEFLKKSQRMLDSRQYIKLIVFDEKVKRDIFSRIRVAPFQP